MIFCAFVLVALPIVASVSVHWTSCVPGGGGGNVDVSMGVGVELVSWVVQVLCVWVVC